MPESIKSAVEPSSARVGEAVMGQLACRVMIDAEGWSLLHGELRGLAAAALRKEQHARTLQPTALAHEAYLRLQKSKQLDLHWRDPAHFCAIAAHVIRQVLTDQARTRLSLCRGGGRATSEITEIVENTRAADVTAQAIDILDLNDALDELAELNPRLAKIVDLRFFGGLTLGETAAILGITSRSVGADWQMARDWLACRLRQP